MQRKPIAKGVRRLANIQNDYQMYFDKIGTDTITKEAQQELMQRPQSWNRYYEQAILNTINDGELQKSEARFYQDYFQDAHERISYKSLEKVVTAMQEAGVKLDKKDGGLKIQSDKLDKVTLMSWLADLFPKHG